MRAWFGARLTGWLRGLLLTGLLIGSAASAHEMSMAEMQVREMAPGEFIWQWTATEKRAASDDLAPVWPDGCTAEVNLLHCGKGGMQGSLSVNGVGKTYSAALVKVYWLDGQSRVYTLTASQPTVHLYGAADDRRGMGEVAWAYTMLGVEHILSGVDHLLFVISLLFLVGFKRNLLWTITAFTAAHSLTLALSALGWLALRSPPVEASIALSIVLVAGEALHQRQTLARPDMMIGSDAEIRGGESHARSYREGSSGGGEAKAELVQAHELGIHRRTSVSVGNQGPLLHRQIEHRESGQRSVLRR